MRISSSTATICSSSDDIGEDRPDVPGRVDYLSVTRDHISPPTGRARLLSSASVAHRVSDDGRSRTVGDADVGRWAYRPRAVATFRADEALAFRSRLASAVRAGHGLDAAFGLRLEGGSEPALYLKTRGRDARRWADRVFVRAYGEDRWRRAAPAPSVVPPTAWWGRRVRPWPSALHSPAEATSLLDLFTLTFTAVRPAIALEAGFTPARVPRSSGW